MARLASKTAMRWGRHAALLREVSALRIGAASPSETWSRADCLASALRRLGEARDARRCYPPARFAIDGGA